MYSHKQEKKCSCLQGTTSNPEKKCSERDVGIVTGRKLNIESVVQAAAMNLK